MCLKQARHLWLLALLAFLAPACGPGNSKTQLPSAPAAPAGLTLTPLSTSQIQATWTDIATNADFYSVDRSTDGINFTRVVLLPAGTSSYLDFNVQPST